MWKYVQSATVLTFIVMRIVSDNPSIDYADGRWLKTVIKVI